MTTMKKIFSMLALLLLTAVGATAQTTYTVTVKDGTEDAAKWSADPNPAGEGQSVTVNYNGKKKVKRVTAVQKNLRPLLALVTTADLGKIAGADGNIYDTKADATAAGTTAVAKIIYVGSSTDNATYTHGLALALTDESGKMTLSMAKGKCPDKNTALPVAGALWVLPSKDQWETMISAAGGYTALRDGFSSVGGTNLLWDYYWSSTWDGYGSEWSSAWSYLFNDGCWYGHGNSSDFYVRACLVF